MKVAELSIEGRACDGECEEVQATERVKANLGYIGRPWGNFVSFISNL